MSSVFYIEQRRDVSEILERLKRLASTLEGLDEDEYIRFKNWLKEIICQGLPKDVQKKVSEIILKDQEADSMISNVTRAIIEDRRKSRREGRAEGIAQGKAEVLIKLLTVKFGQVPKDMIEEINGANESQIEAIISNIFKVQSLEEIKDCFK